MIALELLLFLVISLAFLSYLGYGLVKLLLPAGWRSHEGLLAPLAGYTLFLLVSYYAVRTVFSLAGALLLALGLATLLNGWALWRRRGQGPTLNLREHGPAWLIALLAFAVAVLPLLSYGFSVPIGENWDPENYLPIAAYLQKVPVGRIAEMPANPLRELNANPPRIGMTLGFCLLQGTLGLLRGWDTRQVFAPQLALLYALTVPALWLLFRQGFRLGRTAGLLATAGGGLSALALWIAFFNFGMQMAALPLVPLSWALWLLALRQPSWRTVLLAGLAVAAMPVAYYPALTAFLPVALGLGLGEVIRQWIGAPTPPDEARPETGNCASPTDLPARPRLRPPLPALLAGLSTAILSVALAVGPILDYGQGFSFRYGQQMTTLGLFHFPALEQVLGLAPFSRTPETLPALWNLLILAGLALLLLGNWAAIWSKRPSGLWLAAVIPALLYLVWLRGLFLPAAEALRLPADLLERFRPYPYAFLKGIAFVGPLFWGLAAANWDRLWGAALRQRDSRLRPILLGILAAPALLPLGLVLAADGRLVARYWAQPAHFDAQAISVEGLVKTVPQGEEVYLTGRPERSRVLLGMFSYFLRDHPVQGRLSTGYAGYDRRIPGAEPRYALLDIDDDPYPLGFSAPPSLAAGGMALYERDPAILSFLDLRSDAYTARAPGEIHTKEPLAERLQQSFGPYPPGLAFEPSGSPVLAAPSRRPASAAQPFILYADATRLSRQPDLPGTMGSGALRLAFASLDPATVNLHWSDGTTETCVLPAGFSTCQTRLHALPGSVELRLRYGARMWPCWAALVKEGQPGMQVQPQEVLLWPQARAQDTVFESWITTYNASGRPLRLALEVWENTFNSAAHYAWWGPLPLPEDGAVHLRADLAARTAQAWQGEQEAPFAPHPGAAEWPEVDDGSYFAALWIYYGGHVVEVLPVGQFVIAGGRIEGLQPIQLGPRLLRPPTLPTAGGARFGPAIELNAYALAGGPFSPGDAIPLALEWRALQTVPVDYFVTAQVLKDGRLLGQWDGPIGQWYTARSWRPGQVVRDDIPLHVADDARPGRYRLIVAVYDAATGTRLEVRSPQGQPLGDFLDLGEIVVK